MLILKGLTGVVLWRRRNGERATKRASCAGVGGVASEAGWGVWAAGFLLGSAS